MDQNLYKTPIGLSYPITSGTSGYFQQDFNTLDAAKSSIRLLLGTIKGERRMNPLYGSGLWNYLFSNIDDISEEIVTDIISKDVSDWIPDLSIQSVNIIKKIQNANTYRLELNITFRSTSFNGELESVKFTTDILKN